MSDIRDPVESIIDERPPRQLLQELREENAEILRTRLPRLRALVDKAAASADRRYEKALNDFGRRLTALREEMEEHLEREEAEIFPYAAAAIARERGRDSHALSPTPEAVSDHCAELLDLVDRVRRMGADLVIPDDAPPPLQELSDGLAELESLLATHHEKGRRLATWLRDREEPPEAPGGQS